MRFSFVPEVTEAQVVPLSVDLMMVSLEPDTTKVLFPQVAQYRCWTVSEVTLSKVDPLSVDLTMVPEEPTATKVLFPKVTASPHAKLLFVGEVALSQVVPLSVDLTMIPPFPTATNTPELEEDEEEDVVVNPLEVSY